MHRDTGMSDFRTGRVLAAARVLAACAALLVTVRAMPAAGAEPPDGEVRFNRDIRPILSDACFPCHGPGTQEADLRLDVREMATVPAGSGMTPIVAGDADSSELIRRVFSDDESEHMPPVDSKKTLTDEQKELLRHWVNQSAHYEKHWSFEPPVRVPVPDVPNARGAIRNPVDAFIAQRLAREGLTLSPEADRPTLIRRVAFTLTGLPPTPDEVDRFVNDIAPDAYERMVEQYLASSRFGEEMARHWLDVARYADTHGLHLDNERQMWAYRDYVIRSFNVNKPFDRFTIEQLAGDLLPDPTIEQLTATGFNRCNVTTGEGGSIEEEWYFRNAVDRASTVMEAWLGLTGGCAVCHDHKFDPLSAKEFYSLYAFFYSAADPALDGNALLTNPSIKLITPAHQEQLDQLASQIAAAREAVNEAVAAIEYTDPATLEPPPPVSVIDQVWFDDEVGSGTRVFPSPGHPTTYVTAEEGPVQRGTRALRRTAPGLAQDVFEGGMSFTLPAGGKLFAHVWIDGQNPPKTLMLQYFKDGWLHRAVWGDYDAIEWGAAGTTERVLIGPLPEVGQWVRLEVPIEQVGLQPGDVVTQFALTQFGGTVYWDHVGVTGSSDPASDPQRSLLAWWRQQAGKETPGIPAELADIVRAGPDAAPAPELLRKLRDYYLLNVCADTQELLAPQRAAVASLEKQRNDLMESIPGTFVFRELDTPRESFVMLRGQYNKPGEKVEPDTPAVLPALEKRDPAGRATRLDLAQWLVADNHPLTARVTVNRFWQQVFGTGLVKTSSDFGSQGEVPSHPELLDWLALWMQDNEWNVKELMRMLVCSATFRQSSAASASLVEMDPENRLLARGPRLRLDAEQIRDNALATSGLMCFDMGGRGVKPYQPPNIWEPVGFVGSNTREYVQDHGSALYRRSIYTFFKRTAPPPFMVNFDAPNREQLCSRRERSNTPLQALQLMNDTQHFEAARALAERMVTEGGSSVEQRITYGFRIVLARSPSSDEISIVREALEQHLAKYAANAEAAQQAIHVGESVPQSQESPAELAAYTLVANLLLNLDETLTRN